jgi:hypothetical protein
MTDAPETIWTTGNSQTGSWNNSDVRYCPGTKYTRTDISQARIAQLEEARDLGIIEGDLVAQLLVVAQQARIAELETALRCLNQWFDTDPEIIDAMSPVELLAHQRAHAWVLDALKAKP